MGRFAKLTAAVASSGLVGALAVASIAAPSTAATQIRVLDHEGPYEKQVDLGKAGFSAGDLILGTHQLFDAASPAEVVGRDFERLQVVRVVGAGQDFSFIYDTTIRLAGGDIVASGEGRFSDVFEGGASVPVTGGTGAYEGAAGTFSIAATEVEGEFLITIDLIAG